MRKKSNEEVLTEYEDMTIEEFKKLNPEYVARLEREWEKENGAFFEKMPEGLNMSERIAYVVQTTKKSVTILSDTAPQLKTKKESPRTVPIDSWDKIDQVRINKSS